MSYLTQRLILVFVWKLFPFFLGLLATVMYYEGYITFNLPFDLTSYF